MKTTQKLCLTAVGIVTLLSLSASSQTNLAEQYKNNLANLNVHVVLAGFMDWRVTGGVALAVKSTSNETFWVTDPANIDFITVEGTGSAPQIEIRLAGQTQLLEVATRTENYFVLREPGARSIAAITSATALKMGETVSIVTYWKNAPKLHEARVTQLDVARGLFGLSVKLDSTKAEPGSTQGAPIFNSQGQLVGLYVGGKKVKSYNDQGMGAGAVLPDIGKLFSGRVLNTNEYRIASSFGSKELELHNVQQPKNAKGVRVQVQARVNLAAKTFEAVMDIQDGWGNRTIRLGSVNDTVEIEKVTINY